MMLVSQGGTEGPGCFELSDKDAPKTGVAALQTVTEATAIRYTG
jgi:hypothetical protein